jgi:hypothetical protein
MGGMGPVNRWTLDLCAIWINLDLGCSDFIEFRGKSHQVDRSLRKSQFLSAQAVQHFVSLTPRCQSHWSREKGWKAGHLIIEYNWI